MTKIYIDADGCPVVDIVIKIAAKFGVEVYIITDTSHYFDKPGATTITVSKGADSVDFALVNKVSNNDLVITQDYGLAAMCLAKKTYVMHQDGWMFDEKNIAGLLQSRHLAKKIRISGGRLRGPSKRTSAQNDDFKNNLTKFLCNMP